MTIASFFSGCGGLDLGFEKAGFKIIWANEFDKTIHQTYSYNHPTVNLSTKDIREIDPSEIPDCDGFIGGPPCQAWSVGGKMLGLEDERGKLFITYINLIKSKKPKFFVIENVEGILSDRHFNTFKDFLKFLEEAGYNIHYDLLNTKFYKIPQDRKRVIIVGFRKDLNLNFTFPKHSDKVISLKEAIGDIFCLPNPYKSTVETISNHNGYYNHDVYVGDFDKKYMARNRVRNWDEVSFTIQAQAKNCPIHPQAPKMEYVNPDKRIFAKDKEHLYRRLSIRECARIQTFPDSFIFFYKNIKDGYKMVGNAVPPRLAYHLAISIKKTLFSNTSSISTNFLIAYYKDDKQLALIRSHKLYYVRSGISKNAFKYPIGEISPQYLILHNRNNVCGFSLTQIHPILRTKEYLQSLGFNPKHDTYLSFKIDKEIDYHKIISQFSLKIPKGRGYTNPFIVTVNNFSI